MKVFLIAGAVVALVAIAAYYCLDIFFSANAKAASRDAEEEAKRAGRSKKRRGAGA
ncbi:MAG TPA: hypothetical protein VFA89_02155 [Terriglobales bacterium]|nr:hypothetical protein [Terriglobales bacterium]